MYSTGVSSPPSLCARKVWAGKASGVALRSVWPLAFVMVRPAMVTTPALVLNISMAQKDWCTSQLVANEDRGRLGAPDVAHDAVGGSSGEV